MDFSMILMLMMLPGLIDMLKDLFGGGSNNGEESDGSSMPGGSQNADPTSDQTYTGKLGADGKFAVFQIQATEYASVEDFTITGLELTQRAGIKGYTRIDKIDCKKTVSHPGGFVKQKNSTVTVTVLNQWYYNGGRSITNPQNLMQLLFPATWQTGNPEAGWYDLGAAATSTMTASEYAAITRTNLTQTRVTQDEYNGGVAR